MDDHPPPAWIEFPENKNNGRIKSESGGGSGGGGLGQLRKREEEKNPDMDPRLRVMERLRELFNLANREGHTFKKI